MSEPREEDERKADKRQLGNEEVSSRLSQRLRQRFTQCFTTPSPPPSLLSRRKKRGLSRQSPVAGGTSPGGTTHVLEQETRTGEEVQLNLDSLLCNSSNFELLKKECRRLRQRQKQLKHDMNQMERKATEITNNCCSIVSENNSQLRNVLETTQELDRLVQNLRARLSEQDQLIKELQDQGAQTQEEARPVLAEPTASDSSLYRND